MLGIEEPELPGGYLNRLASVLSMTDGILFTIFKDGLIQNVYGKSIQGTLKIDFKMF